MAHPIGEADEVRRQLAQVRSQLSQREREISEINHRIGNNLQVVSSLLTGQCLRAEDDAVRTALEVARSRIAAVGRFHQHLHVHASARWVDFGKLLGELSGDICASTGMDCEVDAESILLSGDKACKLAILINELIMNAYKHGYDGQEGGTIRLECRPHGCSHMRIAVSDHGKGLPAGFDPEQTHGLGLSVVSSIVREMNGELRVHNGPGAAFEIVVPAP